MNDLVELVWHNLQQVLAHYYTKQPTQNSCSIELALSGGIDSTVLLHILQVLQQQYKQQRSVTFTLSALHINHGISQHSAQWATHCQKYCAYLAIPLQIKQHQVSKTGGESLENNARKIRYAEFSHSDAAIIALAHQQNDQIETMLSQLLRGSDLHNLAAMRMLNNKNSKAKTPMLWRPLLNVSRARIEQYAKKFNLAYIEDESNLDTKYLRNFVRHELLPKLLARDEDVEIKLLKVVSTLQDTLSLVDEVALEDLVKVRTTIDGIDTLMVDIFVQLSMLRQINVLAQYIKQHNLPLPSTLQLKEFINQVVTAAWDKHPQLRLHQEYNLIKKRNLICIEKIRLIKQ